MESSSQQVDLEYVRPGELSVTDLEFLERVLAFADEGFSVPEIVGLACRGQVGILRATGAAQGTAAFQLKETKKGRELFVWLMAGKGLLFHFKELERRLLLVAEGLGCERIRAAVQPRLARLLERRHGYETKWVSMVKEL